MGTVKLTVEYSVSAEDSWWHALRGAFPRNVIVVVLRLLLFLHGTFCHHILFECDCCCGAAAAVVPRDFLSSHFI
ncbi:hypothetical protein P8452_74482 [Trifolium repens]|nr:hypothetical protein P8452_74482 [Trifolium repens]